MMSEPNDSGWRRSRWALGVLSVLLLCGMAPRASGVTVLFAGPNVHVTDGPSVQEYENPLPGAVYTQGYRVLEWRDADYLGPNSYDDWVNAGMGTPEGNVGQVWLRYAGMAISTTTTVAGPTLAVHLVSDANDGLGEIYVDGNLMARLDMGATPYSAWVLIEQLSNTTHTILVLDVGPGQTGEDDVAILGASVLEPKWYQPPEPYVPGNVLYGWNEESICCWDVLVADDWFCNTPDPVTDIHWWGSFRGWHETYPPQEQPPLMQFDISFWTDRPAGIEPFSHPLQLVQKIYAPTYTVTYVGQDYDPRTGQYESAFKFDLVLNPADYFYQDPGTQGNIYWIMITACYGGIEVPPHPFGWKTRPRDVNSLAPDDAVRVLNPAHVCPLVGTLWSDLGGGEPIEWPTGESWDMAFELTSQVIIEDIKWEQPPDPIGPNTFYGWDEWSVYGSPQIVADDWVCMDERPVSDIHWWGSYYGWMNPTPPPDRPTGFMLSIWTDMPTFPSHPGMKIWEWWVPIAETSEVFMGFYDQHPDHPMDTTFYYSADIPQSLWFLQGPMSSIFWLSVAATYQPTPCRCNGDFNGNGTVDIVDLNIFGGCWGLPPTGPCRWVDLNCDGAIGAPDLVILQCMFNVGWPDPACCINPPQAQFVWGWKTRPHITGPAPDAAVRMWRPYDVTWQGGEPIKNYEGPWDAAFRLTTKTIGPGYTKWSQPPVPYVPNDWYYGWDEYSVYGLHIFAQIAADDWVCESDAPVTDVHWWGSFIGWYDPTTPPNPPSQFHIGIWTDVPDDPGNPSDFSHPGQMRWEYWCSDYRVQFAGWDWDPRFPDRAPEATFWFECKLPPGSEFRQEPGCNIYWTSIAASYMLMPPENPFGWKTRPRQTGSMAPDDAVRILAPTAPTIGALWGNGEPIFWPTRAQSWDLAFVMTQGAPQQFQACCLVGQTPSCRDITVAECTTLGGASQGPGTICPDAQGACCVNSDLSCVMIEPICCDDVPGHTPPGGGGPCQGGVPDPVCAYPHPDEACCMPDGTCVDMPHNACVTAGGDPQGGGTDCDIGPVACTPIKYSQPPWYNDLSPHPECFWGWDEPSMYGSTMWIAADDFPCDTEKPIADIHWWGSYLGWDGVDPPPGAPNFFHIGLWTDVPFQPPGFSHPGVMFRQWLVQRADLNERPVACDFHPNYMTSPEGCFKYDFAIPQADWFYQEPACNIYWLSISAMPVATPCPCDGDVDGNGIINLTDWMLVMSCVGQPPIGVCAKADVNCDGVIDQADANAVACLMQGGHPEVCCPAAATWGWKTRPHVFMDDAVRILAPTAPLPGMFFQFGEPIETPAGVSWDLAFVLTTKECTVDEDCEDASVCTDDVCDAGTCTYVNKKYGDINGNGYITLADLFCVLNGFSGDFSVCTKEQDDIHGSCGPGLPPCCPNGVISLADLFAVLNAFAGIDPCCGGGVPAPMAPAGRDISRRDTAGSAGAAIKLVPSAKSIGLGGTLSVDVFISGADDLRGYQVALEAVGGRKGELEVESVIVDRSRRDFVFQGQDSVDAGDPSGSRVLGALLNGGVATSDERYVATFTFRASPDGQGAHRIVVREGGDTLLLDSSGTEMKVRSVTTASVRVR